MKRVLDHRRRDTCIGRIWNLHAAGCNDEGKCFVRGQLRGFETVVISQVILEQLLRLNARIF